MLIYFSPTYCADTAPTFNSAFVICPTDFHAYAEVLLGDRWFMFDPSGTAIPMGFVRFATGRDAADAAFATIFGGVQASPSVISTEAIAGDGGARCHLNNHAI